MTKLLFISIAAVSMMALGLVATANPTFGQDSGTVRTTFVPELPAPCITLSARGIDYGRVNFTPTGSSVPTLGTGGLSVTSCSTAAESLAARGSNAVGSGTGAWTLNQRFLMGCCSTLPCDSTLVNQFGHRVLLANVANSGPLLNAASFQSVTTVGAGAVQALTTQLQMACVGSSGAAETMSTDILFLATIP